MRYNLFKKEAASSWEKAQKKLLKVINLTEERIGDDYTKAFPYDYNAELHFVYEGDLTVPYRINEDFSINFYNDREQVDLGYKILKDGEVLEDDNIRYIHSPGQFYKWDATKWIYDIKIEREYLNNEIQTIERELEDTQVQIDSRKTLGMYTASLEVNISRLLKKHSDLCYELSETNKGE